MAGRATICSLLDAKEKWLLMMEEVKLRGVLLRCVWAPIIGILLTVWGISLLNHQVQQDTRTLRVGWDGDNLRFTPLSDGPFVITHLSRYGATEADKAVAVLAEPLAIVDSAGTRIEAASLKRLVWRSAITYEEVAPPRSGDPVWALYYRPSVAQPRAVAEDQ